MKVQIEQRFCGPPTSGNGGYVAGLLAQQLGPAASVTLRAPPPLKLPLQLWTDGERAELRQAELLLAEAHRIDGATLPLPPVSPSVSVAQTASARYVGHRHHAYPSCFGCGPEREPGDGLCIFPGQVRAGVVAAAWTPLASQVDTDKRVPLPQLWAAIDCAGYWALVDGQAEATPMLLGNIEGRVDASVRLGEACVVVGWRIEQQGRKHIAGTALLNGKGQCVARSRQTWIAPRS